MTIFTFFHHFFPFSGCDKCSFRKSKPFASSLINRCKTHSDWHKITKILEMGKIRDFLLICMGSASNSKWWGKWLGMPEWAFVTTWKKVYFETKLEIAGNLDTFYNYLLCLIHLSIGQGLNFGFLGMETLIIKISLCQILRYFLTFFQVVTNAHSGNLSHLPHHLLIDAKPIQIDTKSLILPISEMGQQPHQDKKWCNLILFFSRKWSKNAKFQPISGM